MKLHILNEACLACRARIEFPEHPSALFCSNQLAWQHSISSFICSPSLKWPSGNVLHVYHSTTVNWKGVQVWMEGLHLECHVAAELLVTSSKIFLNWWLLYLSETNCNMLKDIPGCLLYVTDSKIKLRISEELMHLWTNKHTRLNLLCIKPWEFLTQK